MAGRAPLAALVVSVLLVGCGGDDDDDAGSEDATEATEGSSDRASDDASESDSGADGDDSALGDDGIGDQGGISFEISGGYELSADYSFIAGASVFDQGGWSMTFTDTSTDGGVVLIVTILPDVKNLSFGNDEFTVSGAEPECSFDIGHQDEDGASGSIECDGLLGIGASGTIPGVDFRATFDVTA